jgi:hypothetical protein
VWFIREAFQQCRRQSRLADARLARKKHYLAFAGLYLRPATQQNFDFLFSADKLSQTARVHGLEAAFD